MQNATVAEQRLTHVQAISGVLLFLVYLLLSVSTVIWYFSLIRDCSFMEATSYQEMLEEVDRLEHEYGETAIKSGAKESAAGKFWLETARNDFLELRSEQLGRNDWQNAYLTPMRRAYLTLTFRPICFLVEYFHVRVFSACLILVCSYLLLALLLADSVLRWIVESAVRSH